VSAPALPRLDLQAAADKADAAYTQAVRDAAQTGNWYGVPAAAHAFKQARSALTAAKEDVA
jgi:hypothetical protein